MCTCCVLTGLGDQVQSLFWLTGKVYYVLAACWLPIWEFGCLFGSLFGYQVKLCACCVETGLGVQAHFFHFDEQARYSAVACIHKPRRVDTG